MSPPPPTEQKNLKRPRGLLASRKSAKNSSEPGPKAKKPRAEEPQEDLDQDALNLQDWNDLKELFENVLDAFYGPNPVSALPLVRGVLHECARLVSAHADPTVIYSPTEQGDKSQQSEPASAFYTIYASAWVLMSTFARTDESLMAADEPKEPLAYVLSALAACEEGQKALYARGEEKKSWDLEFIWGRALIGAAQCLLESEENVATFQSATKSTVESQTGAIPSQITLTDPNASAAFERAVQYLLFAVKNYPRAGAEVDAEDEKKTRDDRFARTFLDTAQATLSIAEELQSGSDTESTEDDQRDEKTLQYLRHARELFVLLAGLDFAPPDVRVQAVFGEARGGLAIGSAAAEGLEDGGDEDERASGASRDDTIKILKQAIEKFEEVRKLNVSLKNDKDKVPEDEIKPLLQEALVTLATLLPEGSEQDSMYARYTAEGGVLDDEDKDEDERGGFWKRKLI